MRFAAAISTRGDARDAGLELAGSVEQAVPSPDLALLFVGGQSPESAVQAAAAVRKRLSPRALIGCTCEGVIGGDRELERIPGASLLAASLPGVELRPFHVAVSAWESLLGDDERLQQAIGTGSDHRGQVLLGDPFTTPAVELVDALNRVFPALPTSGGMASAARRPGENVLIVDDACYAEGAVGVGIGGRVRLDTVVSQGCRPIGKPLVITKAEGSFILELSRRPALEVAHETLGALPASERALLENGLFIGLVINEYQPEFHRGDFLVRNLMGVVRESGALVIGEFVRPGQTLQFHVRDAETASEDLDLLLQPQTSLRRPEGGVLFSCNGRGTRMFQNSDHDVRSVLSHLPELPIAGFFAAGELGPVGGRTFLHGHTASLLLFREF